MMRGMVLFTLLVLAFWKSCDAEIRSCAVHDGYEAVDACGEIYRLCEPHFFALLDDRGCFVLCDRCQNFTYTKGLNNCTSCLSCSNCSPESEQYESCASQCMLPMPATTTAPGECPQPEVQNGDVNCSSGRSIGSLCQVDCFHGFAGGGTTECLINGTWSNVPACSSHPTGLQIHDLLITVVVAVCVVILVFIACVITLCMICCRVRKKKYSEAPQTELQEMG